jgi:hypothetical protein
VASILLMTGSVLGWAGGSFFIYFVIGLFGGDCDSPDCGAYAGATAEQTAIVIAAGVVVVGLAVTIVRLATRRRAWPFALGAFVLCGVCITIGGGVFLIDA